MNISVWRKGPRKLISCLWMTSDPEGPPCSNSSWCLSHLPAPGSRAILVLAQELLESRACPLPCLSVLPLQQELQLMEVVVECGPRCWPPHCPGCCFLTNSMGEPRGPVWNLTVFFHRPLQSGLAPGAPASALEPALTPADCLLVPWTLCRRA